MLFVYELLLITGITITRFNVKQTMNKLRKIGMNCFKLLKCLYLFIDIIIFIIIVIIIIILSLDLLSLLLFKKSIVINNYWQ